MNLITSKIKLEEELKAAELYHREEYGDIWEQLNYAWRVNGQLHNMVDRLQEIMDNEAERLQRMLQKVPEQISAVSYSQNMETEERNRQTNRLREAEEREQESFVSNVTEADKAMTGSQI